MKTFVILGMHRSATSLSAQGLHRCGVHIGSKLLGTHESNKYGHYEDTDFIWWNDQILKMAGGSWDNPPPDDEILKTGEENKNEIKKFIRVKEVEPFWGWKDPRTTLTIKCYLSYLTNPHFICCYREPDEVAASLWKRDNMPLDKGLELAKIYNTRMIEFLQGQYSE